MNKILAVILCGLFSIALNASNMGWYPISTPHESLPYDPPPDFFPLPNGIHYELPSPSHIIDLGPSRHRNR